MLRNDFQLIFLLTPLVKTKLITFLANVGKLGVRRPVEEDIADDDLAALAQRGMLARQRRRLLREHKRDTADRILESIELTARCCETAQRCRG